MDRKYEVNCDAYGSAPMEFFNLEKNKKRAIVADVDMTSIIRDLTETAGNWLPAAAEKLNISSKLTDYLLTPVISMPSDLPNKNAVAFPLRELTAWVPDHGQQMYKTWVGKPCFKDHQNKDHTKAKGVILDCIMKPIVASNGGLWKVIKLAAWDRTRDALLCNDILTGKSHHYSMGANASNFSCSVCGNTLSAGGCEHVSLGKPQMKVFANNRLGYYNVLNSVGFELSSVGSGAYHSASNVPFFNYGV